MTHLTSDQSANWLRNQCGHDSRTVTGCPHCAVADELERLRAALRPFADAHHEARRFLTRLGENRSVMETRDLYMWYAPRHLNMDNFARAVIALGENGG